MNYLKWNLLIWQLFLLPALAISQTESSEHISWLRAHCDAIHCRLVFQTTRPLAYQYFSLQNPMRLILNIEPIARMQALAPTVWRATPIKNAFFSVDHNQLHITFIVKKGIYPYFTSLPANNEFNDRLVIDLEWTPRSTLSQTIKTTTLSTKIIADHAAKYSSLEVSQLPRSLSFLPQKHNSKIIVVIDPGHGGHDPGAAGPQGVMEKNLVLSISKFLAFDINKTPGFKAYLTRTGDYYLTLRQRLAIARRDKADLFVAIHADAARQNQAATGATVFALSERGATSEAARWIAKQENKSELMGGLDLADKNNLLKSVLINLSQTATIQESLQLGQQLITSLNQITSMHHYIVEQAAFVVLKSPDIPSLLIETGFISNSREEKRLSNTYYQQQLANSIAKGIDVYFEQNPPRGTILADKKFKEKF